MLSGSEPGGLRDPDSRCRASGVSARLRGLGFRV